jgi:hypothetical protein
VRQRARQACDPGEPEHRGDEQDDVAAGYGQEVGEPRGAEGLERVLVERPAASQRYPGRDARRLVVAACGKCRARAPAEVIENPLDAAAPAELNDGVGGERLMHPLARQPRPPVEAVARRRDGRQRAVDLDDRALLQGAACTQLDRVAAELRDRRAAVGPGPRLAVDHEAGARDTPDACTQGVVGAPRAAVRRPARAYQQTGDGDERGERGRATRPLHKRQQCEHDQCAAERSRGSQRGQDEPDRQPGSGRCSQVVDAKVARHNASRGRSCSRRTGPIPLTSSSSSTERNPPCATR